MICELPHHTDRSEIGSAAAGRRLERAVALWIGAAAAAGLAGLAMRRRPVPQGGVRPRTDRPPSIRGCPLRRAVVTGDSMLPAFQPGDRIVLGPAWRVRPGQIVGLADPRRPERLLVKRVRSIDSAWRPGRRRQPVGQHRQPAFRPGRPFTAGGTGRVPIWAPGPYRLVAGLASFGMPPSRVREQQSAPGALLPLRRPPAPPASRTATDRRRRVGSFRAGQDGHRRLYSPVYRHWFRADWEGLEKIPVAGGALLVANHAGAIPADAPVIMHGIEEELGRPVYGLADYMFRSLPLVGTAWSRAGGVAAHPDNAYRLLREQQELVLVFPEGTKGTGKLFSQRYRLRRFGRGGFVEIAMRLGRSRGPDQWSSAARRPCRSWPSRPGWRGALGLPYVPLTANMCLLGPLGLITYLPAKFKLRVLDPVGLRRAARPGALPAEPGVRRGRGDPPEHAAESLRHAPAATQRVVRLSGLGAGPWVAGS